MLALLNWIIAEDASPTMWVTSSDEEALKFANERFMPSLRLCPPVANQFLSDRMLAKSIESMFPTMMLEVVGGQLGGLFSVRHLRQDHSNSMALCVAL
jgi:hypothetical protein